MRRILLLLLPIVAIAQQPAKFNNVWVNDSLKVGNKVQAPLYKQGADTLATKAYARSLSSSLVNKVNYSDSLTTFVTPSQLYDSMQVINIDTANFLDKTDTVNRKKVVTRKFTDSTYQVKLTNPVTGTGVANEIAYWSGTNAITSNPAFYTQVGTNNRYFLKNAATTNSGGIQALNSAGSTMFYMIGYGSAFSTVGKRLWVELSQSQNAPLTVSTNATHMFSFLSNGSIEYGLGKYINHRQAFVSGNTETETNNDARWYATSTNPLNVDFREAGNWINKFTIASTGSITMPDAATITQTNNVATNSTTNNALSLTNTTAATGSLTGLQSPSTYYYVNGYDATNLISKAQHYRINATGASGSSLWSNLTFQSSPDGTTYTTRMSISNTGTISGGIYSATSYFTGTQSISSYPTATYTQSHYNTNPSAATVGTTKKYSSIALISRAWNTTSVSSDEHAWRLTSDPFNGATTSSNLNIDYFLNSAGLVTPFKFATDGTYQKLTNYDYKLATLAGGTTPTPTTNDVRWGSGTQALSVDVYNAGWVNVANVSKTGDVYKGTTSVTDSILPTRKWVNNAIGAATTGALEDRGSYNASVDAFPTTGGSGGGGAVVIGDKWTISVKGIASGDSLRVGDVIIATANTPGQTLTNWNHIPVTQPKSVNLLVGGDAKNGAIEYTGATKKAGKWFAAGNGGTYPTTNTVSQYLSYDGGLGATFFRTNPTNVYLGTPTGSEYMHLRTDVSELRLYSNSAIRTLLSPGSSTSDVAYVFDTKNSKSVDLAQFKVQGALKASIDQNGKGTFNGGLGSSEYTSVTVNNTTNCFEAYQNGTGTAIHAKGYGSSGVGVLGATYYGTSEPSGITLGIDGRLTNGAQIKSSKYIPLIIDFGAASVIPSANILTSFRTRGVQVANIDTLGKGNFKAITLQAGGTAAGSAPLKFTTQASGLATVEQGAMELIGNSLQFTNLAVRRSVVQALSVQESDLTVSNTTTETEILSIPHGANYLEVGKMEKGEIQGAITSVSGAGSNTLTIRVKYAGTEYASFVIPELARTAQNIEIHIMTTCRAIGNGTTSMQIHARAEIDNEANNATVNILATGLNSTTAQATTVTAQWSDASASNTLTSLQSYVLCIDKNK
jgi:hypothetical protein